MSNSNWYKVDNVAKVFLATAGNRDTRTLRVSCTLTEDIDPVILQEALNQTLLVRPQFQVRIRRGLFWHYMEETDIEPVVIEETGRVCPILYSPGQGKALHYQVSYYGKRINFDLFHAISDGTGALDFLNIMVVNYLNLKYDGKYEHIASTTGASADDLSEDSYKQFYEKNAKAGEGMKKAYHPRGLKLPYDQLQFFEVQIDAAKLLTIAKGMGVSLTSYLGALLMLSIQEDMPTLSKDQPVTVSMPVNLRNYYPSNTSRNFFNNVNVTHVFSEEISVEDLAKEFDLSLKSNLTPEKIKSQMDNYERMEALMPVRAVPLLIKQPVVRAGSKEQDKKVSVVLSNLGVHKPDADIAKHIENFSSFCSSSNLFVTAQSYNGVLTLGITSPYSNTGVVKTFVRSITSQDIPVTVYATEVIR